MVIYRGTDGSPGYHQTDEVHDAVAFVEQLRNERGVEEARIFRMEQVTFEYRPYFRVELTASEPALAAATAKPAVGAAPAAPAGSAAPAAPVETAAPTAPVVEVPDAAAGSASPSPEVPTPPVTDSNGDVGARRGLFGR
jgi:hypothetical protein